MAETETSGSSKRRRISPSSNSISLWDLPNGALSHAVDYLARPSRVLFAIAINSASDDELSRFILDLSWAQQNREQHDILDFGDIEPSLAAKLTDHDLQTILIRINANTQLKRLKLAGCVNITGAGLDPLRGSVILEQVDLSLVAEHKSPILDPEPLLSCDHVLPILGSIIGRDDNIVKHLTFPKSWRHEGNTALTEFMGRCNEMFERRNITCTHCDGLVGEHGLVEWGWFPLEGQFYGQQSFTCFSCMKHYCHECNDGKGGFHFPMTNCKCCEKVYCLDCSSVESCKGCYKDHCKECKPVEECAGCGDKCCSECIENCVGSPGGCDGTLKFCYECASERGECDKCCKRFCDACWSHPNRHECEKCGRVYCGDCRESTDGASCENCAGRRWVLSAGVAKMIN